MFFRVPCVFPFLVFIFFYGCDMPPSVDVVSLCSPFSIVMALGRIVGIFFFKVFFI